MLFWLCKGPRARCRVVGHSLRLRNSDRHCSSENCGLVFRSTTVTMPPHPSQIATTIGTQKWPQVAQLVFHKVMQQHASPRDIFEGDEDVSRYRRVRLRVMPQGFRVKVYEDSGHGWHDLMVGSANLVSNFEVLVRYLELKHSYS